MGFTIRAGVKLDGIHVQSFGCFELLGVRLNEQTDFDAFFFKGRNGGLQRPLLAHNV